MSADLPYYYRLRGQTLGPFSIDQMQQRAATGKIGKQTQISRDGMAWCRAEEAPELFETPYSSRGTEEQWHYQGLAGSQSEAGTSGILAMLAGGQLTISSLVWKPGFTQWKPIHDVPEITSLMPPATAPLTPPDDPTEDRLALGSSQVFCRECGAAINRLAVICPKCGVPAGDRPAAAVTISGGSRKNKFIAAILAFFLGGLGVHHFYLGNPAIGILYLLFCWTLIPAIISLVEFVVFLVMPEKDFDTQYNS